MPGACRAAGMTRLEFHRRVERPATALLLFSLALWMCTLIEGNTLGGFELSVRAALVGLLIGLFVAVPFGLRNVEALPGLMGPVKRMLMLCVNAALMGDVVFGTFALALNRYLPAAASTERIYLVKEVCKQRAGWIVALEASNGERYWHIFPGDFGAIPIGAAIKFETQTGVFGYSYFHRYERVSR